MIDVEDCPGQCAIDGVCGSEAECAASSMLLAILLSVLGIVCLFTIIICCCCCYTAAKTVQGANEAIDLMAKKSSHKEPFL